MVLNEERTISNWIGTINPDTKRVGIYLSNQRSQTDYRAAASAATLQYITIIITIL